MWEINQRNVGEFLSNLCQGLVLTLTSTSIPVAEGMSACGVDPH